jgi:Ribbon-helix-helix domain
MPKSKATSGRKGKPLTIYFPRQQANRLRRLSEQRQVPMANIVRFAIDRLLVDLNNGQLELPLGLAAGVQEPLL